MYLGDIIGQQEVQNNIRYVLGSICKQSLVGPGHL